MGFEEKTGVCPVSGGQLYVAEGFVVVTLFSFQTGEHKQDAQ